MSLYTSFIVIFWLWSNEVGNLTLWIVTFYQEILHETHGNMPIVLQDKSTFCVLGQCATNHSDNRLMVGIESNKGRFSNCGCLMSDGLLDQSRRAFLGKSNWVLLTFDSHEQNDTGIHGLPKLHHIHWNGKPVLQYDVHVCKSWLLLLVFFAFLKLVT